jgi:hypothetical protein
MENLDIDSWREDVLWAIDVMTACTEAPNDPDAPDGSTYFGMIRAEQYVREPDGDRRLRRGLIGLAGLRLFRAAQEEPGSDVTPDAARAFLHNIAQGLAQ